MSESIKIINNKTVGTTNENVGKRHDDFSSVATMANWSGNRKWEDGYRAITDETVQETETTNLWKTMNVASEDVFNELYKSVANLSDNIANLDLCTVSTLKDRAAEYGIDAGIMKIWENFPVEIAKMVDVFSINKAHIRGVVEEWSNNVRKYALTTIASEKLWNLIISECGDDESYRKFIRNTFYNTLVSFVNMTPASGGDTPIWNMNGASNRRFSTDLFFSRIEYANPVEASHYSTYDGSGSSDADREIYDRKQKLGIPRYFSEKYYADDILIGNRSLNDFTDAEQEVISMEIERRKSLWKDSGVDQYTYVREAKVLHYVRFVTLLANSIYDVGDYDIDKRKSELLDLDKSKYLIRSDGGEYSVDYSMIESVADVLTDYCINVSYFRETIRVEAQKNMLKGTKALLVDSIREVLAKNVYSVYGGSENFWRQTNIDGVVGLGVEMPKDLEIDIIEYIDNTRYTNIYAKANDDKSVVNSRFWQISGVQGDLDPDDVLDFYNRLTDYKDPWKIFQCANSTDEQVDPKVNLYQHLNYVFNSGAFSANLTDLVFDTTTVSERLSTRMSGIYGYDEILASINGAKTSADVPERLPKVFFDSKSAAGTLLDAFEEIDCGDPQYKPENPDEFTDEYAALYNRYHDYNTIRELISSFKTPDEFIANASTLFPSAYFDTIKTKDYLSEKIVYRNSETSSIQLQEVYDATGQLISSNEVVDMTLATSSLQQTLKTEGGFTTIITTSGTTVSVLPEKPYTSITGLDNSFDSAWKVLLDNPEYQKPERLHEIFYYVSEYPSLYDEVFGDYSNYRHDSVINTIQTIGDGFNYDAYNALYDTDVYAGTMVHESGTFGEALYDHIGDVTWGIRPFANSQNTVHPSVQVHAFVNALIEYVNSYHSIVKYLDVNQPRFATYCQTVVDRVDKLGNTIHYWKNSVDDFSGYTTDYEKAGNDADEKKSIEGPFDLDALTDLLADKATFIDGIKRGTNKYYISKVNGTFVLNDVEKQSEIDNITIYYDDICLLAKKEIARFGRDKYGNTYVLYKESGHRTDRDRLGKLWIRKADHPLAFPGIVVDELSGKLSNVSQVSLTDNSEIEKKIIEQYKYPQRIYDDIRMVGCYITNVVQAGPTNTRCYKVKWSKIKQRFGEGVVNSIRNKNGYTEFLSPIVEKYFTFDDDGSFVPAGKEGKIWDSGSDNPGYCGENEEIRGYASDVSICDYAEGDLLMEMDNYDGVNYDIDEEFSYHIKSGNIQSYVDNTVDDVKEITFVVCKDNANVEGSSNNFFLDEVIGGKEGNHHSITFHNLTIYGIYTIRLPRGGADTTNERRAVVRMSTLGNTFTVDKIEDTDPIPSGATTKPLKTLVGSMSIGGDDTNELIVDFDGNASEKSSGSVTIDGNGQNIGKYYDFTLNGTLDVILLDVKDPHFEGYDKSWALDATINQPGNTDGTREIQLFKDSQHNVEKVWMSDILTNDGIRYRGIHCGNVNAGNRVHAIFARIKEECDAFGNYVPTRDVSFTCNTFGYDTYYESIFAPKVRYEPYLYGGNYHFRVNSDDETVYVAFCSSLPKDEDRVGNYVSGYDGMVAGSSTFNRCSKLGYLNGVTVVGFDVVKKGLAFNDDIRYVLKNETICYYPQYSGLIGRNMTYANPSMVWRDLFGFELMFDKIDGGAESIEAVAEPLMPSIPYKVKIADCYDGGMFLEYDKYTSFVASDPQVMETKDSFIIGSGNVIDVDLGISSFYAMGYDVHEDDGTYVKDDPFSLGFLDKIVAKTEFESPLDYDDYRPSRCQGANASRIDVILDDIDYDDDGNATTTSLSTSIVEVSNIDVNGNFIIVCRDNTVLSCHYDHEESAIYIKSVTRFEMNDFLNQVDNTFDGKFVAYPKNLTSGQINFIHATTNAAGFLEFGYYVTEYADTATIKDVEIFGNDVFIIFDGVSGMSTINSNIDHVFKVGNCFDAEQKCVEEFIILDGEGGKYATFTSDNDHLFLIPSQLSGMVLIYNPQTDKFDAAYQLDKIIPTVDQFSNVIASRITDEKLRILAYQKDDTSTEVDESRSCREFVIDIGSNCNYAILELDKDFPILVTYDHRPNDIPGHTEGWAEDDDIELHFRCLFNTNPSGRQVHSLYSWERKSVDFAYNKATESGREFDAKERYGSSENEYVYGDSRVYRITATGCRKFYIERLYREGNFATGEFDEDAYLSFVYDLRGCSNARKNRMFAHWNPTTTFRYTVSGPFTDIGAELGTQYEVKRAIKEISERFKGLSLSRDFNTYWLSGEMLHLSSVVEPSDPQYKNLDRLVDSNLSFAENTIISSCESMFGGHVNLHCRGRKLAFNAYDNTQYINNAESMFCGDVKLELPEVDITGSNLLNTVSMFEDCRIAPLAGASFPSHLTSVERMFANCSSTAFSWNMLMPGTVVSSLSSVFYNCENGTFANFLFEGFPRHRVIDNTLGEIITLADYDVSESGDVSYQSSSDNERNLNDDYNGIKWTLVKIADHNEEAGRYFTETEWHIETWIEWEKRSGVNPESGRFTSDTDSQASLVDEKFLSFDMDSDATLPLLNYGGDNVEYYVPVEKSKKVIDVQGDDPALIDDEKFLSFDMDMAGSRPMLNLDDEVFAPMSSIVSHIDLDDLNHEHGGRFANVVANDMIADFMFFNTKKFISNYIAFEKVGHTLCSTVSMFEKCGTPPATYIAEDGRFMSDSDEQRNIEQERFFSFDMPNTMKLMNLAPDDDTEIDRGLKTFDGIVELPNLVDGRRMFRGSAFRMYDTTICTGRRVEKFSEAFRRCTCIFDRGPRVQTYDFKGSIEVVDGKLVVKYIPLDMRAMYAECNQMTSVDIELLGDVLELSSTDKYPDDMFKLDFMCFGCDLLESVTGKINRFATSARGMFANCNYLTIDAIAPFLREVYRTCDITGMFWNCERIPATDANRNAIRAALVRTTGDPFERPSELDGKGELPWDIYDER